MGDRFESLTNRTRPRCSDGLIITAAETTLTNVVLYFLALLYCFLGIAIVADVFMRSIEKITSATRKVNLKHSRKNDLIATETNNSNEGVKVRIWNPAVANLTLMALGSSAPEILLAVIETVGNHFRAGDLGPGTIVGSAAFNLLCITAVCILAVPSPEVKRIQQISVFVVTSLFSCWAYIWLLIIMVVISPNIVELWEALLTLGFFIILIIFAYLADVKGWKRKKACLEEFQTDGFADRDQKTLLELDEINKCLEKLAENRKTSILLPDHETMRLISRWILRTNPTLSLNEQSRLLAYIIRNIQGHDRLWYRIEAVRHLSAAVQKMDSKWGTKKLIDEMDYAKKTVTFERTVEFSARVYSIVKGNNKVMLRVVRRGSTQKPLTVRYTTKSGVAKKDLHFLQRSETIQFKSGESVKEIYVDLVEGAKWLPNHVFYVQLKLLQNNGNEEKIMLGRTNVATIQVPDDSASFVGEPMVQFVKSNYVVKENEKYVRAFVTRLGRHDECTFSVQYETEAVTAKCGEDFEAVKNGFLMFVGNEYEKYIDVRIYDDMTEEKDETFNINLVASSGAVTIGPNKRTIITIICDDNVIRNIANVHKLASHYLKKMTYGADTWLQQLIEATSVNAGDIENATFTDCIKHVLSFPWKVLVALIPPVCILGGWLAFSCALILTGFITAIVGDLASIFGCMVGLKDAITATTLVALGTSVPDMFASRIAAQNDATADNAIGNVTASNAVNVFLGLGVPWTISAIYWMTQNQAFNVNAGNLSFSVALFMVISAVCLILLITRRLLIFFGRGELGGPFGAKIFSVLIFIGLWWAYVLLSIFEAYDYITA